MNTHIIYILVILFISACSSKQEEVTLVRIDAEEQAGNFSKAQKLIDLYIAQNDLSEKEIYDLNFRKDIMDRIGVDFSKKKDDVKGFIKK